MSKRWIFVITIGLAMTCIAGCGSSATAPFQEPLSPNKTAVAATPSPALGRLYVSDVGHPGTVKAYAWPSKQLGNPLATLAGGNGPSGMTFDKAGNLFVANTDSQIVQVFSQPIINGAKPEFSLKPFLLICFTSCSFRSSLPDVAVDAMNNLALDSGGSVSSVRCVEVCFETTTFKRALYVYLAPVSASSSPHVISFGCQVTFKGGTRTGSTCPASGFGFFADLAFDRIGDLWAARSDGYLEEYTSPATSSTPTLTVPIQVNGLKFDSAGNLYVSTSSSVDVYRSPFSAPMIKAFSINVSAPGYLDFDDAGNLYVSSAGKNVLVFAPPFSSASVPVITLSLAASGVAIGR